MPGPRSKGCAICKIRKIKCDQQWPTCSPCRRKGATCPGPAPLVRHGTTDRKPNSTDGKIPLSTPRSAPSTLADHVAAQLVRHLKTAPDRGIVIQTRYLKDLPKRLSQNSSLRDTISLFYTVWANHCRQKPAVDFITLPEYGKAIRSLRLALSSDQAFTIETLASATILHRAEEVFNPSHHKVMHQQGIASLMAAIGKPNRNDEFQTTLMAEIFIIMVPHSVATGWKNNLNTPDWKDAIEKNLSSCIQNEEARSQFRLTLRKCGDMVSRLPTLVHMIRTSGPGVGQDERKAELKKEFQKTIMGLQRRIIALVGKLIQVGEITEEKDPKSIAGTSYSFSSVTLAQMLLSMQSFHLGFARMLYDWSLAEHFPDVGAQYQNLKELCVHIWKHIKFLRNLEPFVASATPRGLYITLELANPEQKSHLLDLFAEINCFLRRLSSDREEMERQILSQARLLTGRRP
ncbi:unnamed protein product [Clonostachys rosea]|uniref:Zn(2)-C6 fungal-type domain-containing protein n=1 Tax=Bionectria ochroleuca TaxID=29856 RepID=A0ABY6UTW6_BIOOC|nr:unnamed protein product [Clonostachys rosea]